MSTGPQLKSRPLLSVSASDAKERLAALENWTEEPARAQAGDMGLQAMEKPGEVKPVLGRQLTLAPWHDPVMPELTHPVTFRIPRELYLQLRYLGDTTKGEKQITIVVKALETEIEKRLRERNISQLNSLGDEP